MPFPVNVKIKIKGSGQEWPLYTIKTKIKVNARLSRGTKVEYPAMT